MDKDEICEACGEPRQLATHFCGACGAASTEVDAPDTDGAPTGCPTCGHVAVEGARFCVECGHDFENPAPADRAPVRLLSRVPKAALVGGLVALVLVVGGVSWAVVGGNLSAGPSVAGMPRGRQTVWVTRTTRLRDMPTADGSQVLSDLTRGQRLEGKWIMGSDGETPWLETEWQGQTAYAWSRNLTDAELPTLTEPMEGERLLAAGAVVRERPNDSTEALDTLTASTEVEPVGGVGNGWVEIVRTGGGVGYVKASELSFPMPSDSDFTQVVSRMTRQPVLIASLSTCQAGSQPVGPNGGSQPVQVCGYCVVTVGARVVGDVMAGGGSTLTAEREVGSVALRRALSYSHPDVSPASGTPGVWVVAGSGLQKSTGQWQAFSQNLSERAGYRRMTGWNAWNAAFMGADVPDAVVRTLRNNPALASEAANLIGGC